MAPEQASRAVGRSAPLFLYRTLGEALAPLAPTLLRVRGWLRRSTLSAVERRRGAERLARASATRPHGRLVWIAARRAAELEALSPVVDRLAAAGFQVLATTRDEGEPAPRLPPLALHQYAPLDAPRFCAAFLSFWRPDVAIFAGLERPPALIVETRRRGVPTALVDARLQAPRAALSRAPVFGHALFSDFDPCLAHAQADAERLKRAGAPHARWVGDPLYDLGPEPADAAMLGLLGARVGARPAWCAFVHDGAEADLVIEAQRELCAALPGAVVLIVPRRAAAAASLARRAGKRGLDAQIVSAQANEGPAPAVLIAPGAGEGTALRAAPVAYLGGLAASSRPWIGLWDEPAGRGARNPVSAAKLQCAILHGLRLGGFAPVYDALDEADAAAPVADAADLAAELVALLADAALVRERGRAAAQEVERRSGASTQIMQALSPILAHVFLRPAVDDADGA